MDIVFAYVTVPDHETALRLAQGAVERHLAACANIFPGMVSVYRWQGEMQVDLEEVLILKTRQALFDDLSAWVAEQHPYTVPCILQLPVSGGNVPYVNWLLGETEGEVG